MKLFEPLKIGNIELKNRIVMSPMCMYSAENGVANDFHLVHYASRAQGGIGLIIIEATAVEPRGRITRKCLGIWNDEQAAALKKIVDFVHKNSESKIGIQLAHSGRKGSTWDGRQTNDWETLAPSPIPYHPSERIPHELSAEEIKNLAKDFGKAAKRAVESGFDVIEIHAAHGYLIHQFLSPISNLRTDNYGGNFENRSRFLLQIIDSVNPELTEHQTLFVRISGTEYAENGWNINDSEELAKILKQKNVSLIDVSSGGNIHNAKITLFDGYQVALSESVKKNADIPTGTVGLITTTKQAEEILENRWADLIFFGRQILRNPYFAVHASWQNDENCFFPEQYERAKPVR